MTSDVAESDYEYSDSSDRDEDSEYSSDENNLRKVLDPGGDLRAGRQALGLTRNYVPDWIPRDAFREFFQNWKDDIIDKNGLEPGQFFLDIEDTKEAYVAKACASDINQGSSHGEAKTKRLLGFIRYSKKEGSLQLTNFKSALTREALGLGFTTKRKKKNLAGKHGEGFKVASLIMVNKGYQVRIEASGFYWKFKYFGNNPHNLYCVLSAAGENKMVKDMAKQRRNRATGIPRGLTANIWEDVTVKIGKVYRPWSESAGVKLSDFRGWLKASLDLDRPSKVIKTSNGSLILDPEFQGRLYLRDLLLEINHPISVSERCFKFGYNLMHGKVNRDRQSLSSSAEEAKGFALIWKEAIQNTPEDTLKNYVELLREGDIWADVSLAKDYIDEVTANAIWQYHLGEDPERNRFYYGDKSGEHDVELIRKSLKREPIQLSSYIWEPLRRWGLVRTPHEQQYHLLRNAPIATVTDNLYSSGVRRALSAALAVDRRTRELNLTFRTGYTAGLELLIDGPDLLIHDQCLDFDAGHDTNPCGLMILASTRGMQIETFSCDHIVMDLYDLILNEMKKEPRSNGDEPTQTNNSLYLQVSESMKEMPLKIETRQGSKTGEIEVSWVDYASVVTSRLHGLNIKGRIVLHRESSCSHKRLELLSPEETYNDEIELPGIDATIQANQGVAECGCPVQIVSQKDSTTTFRDLELNEEYFPMIARINAKSFFGLPPSGIRPKEQDKKNFIEPDSVGGTRSDPLHLACIEDYNTDGGVSDGDEDNMQVDLPCRGLPSQEPNKTAEPVQHSNYGLFACTPTLSSSRRHVSQTPRTSSRRTAAENNQEMTRLQDEKQTLQEQLDDVRRQLDTSNDDLLETNAKLESLRMAFDLKDRELQANARQSHDIQHNFNDIQQQFQGASQQSAALLAETQNLREEREVLNRRLRDMERDNRELQAEIDTLRGIDELRREKLKSAEDELLAEQNRLGEAQKVIEVLCETNAEGEQTLNQSSSTPDLHAEYRQEIERLEAKFREVRETRDSLRAELRETRIDARKDHEATREALLHMMGLREFESQPARMARTEHLGEHLGEASGSASRVRDKRQSVDESENSASPSRGRKRMKQ